jgi:hypothetical protein
MDTLSERRKAILYLALAAILWSTSGLFVKILDWQPISILAGRSFFASHRLSHLPAPHPYPL